MKLATVSSFLVDTMKTYDSGDGRNDAGTSKVTRIVPRLRLVPPLRSGVLVKGMLEAPDEMPPVITMISSWEETQ